MAHKTYSFVKSTKRDIYWKLRKKEVEFLLDPKTGSIKEEFAEKVDGCLLCKSPEKETLFKKEGFEFRRCSGCGFIYAAPQIKEEKLISFYEGTSSNDAWIDVLLSNNNFLYDEKKYTEGLDLIESLRKPGRILDIGCSIGHFLKIARDRKWDTLGLELNKRAVKYARENWGLTIMEKLLSEAALPDASFEAVTMWGVIEHLKSPCEVILEINRILAPGGVLLTFCPNVESLVCRILHEKTSCIDGRNHCGYFSPKTIRYLFEKSGFEVVKVKAFQPELDTILNYLDFSDPYLKRSERNNAIKEALGDNLKEITEQILLDRNLGYKMMVLAKRTG